MQENMTDKDAVHTLKGLIETTLDSAEGYAAAAKDAENPRFKTLFAERAQSRKQIVSTLQGQVRSLGATPEDDGTMLASAHRAFLNLKNTLTGDDETVVKEVERGEDHIKEKYEAALKSGKLSPAGLDAVTRAYATIKADHDRMSNLKHSMKH